MLSSLGGALGVGLAWTLVRAAPLLAARDFPRLDAIAIHLQVIACAAAAALLTAIVSGLAPALRGSRVTLAESLHGGDGATAGGFRDRRARHLRDALLAAEAAFAVLLVTRLMRGALFGIAPLDPVSFAAAPLALVPVAFSPPRFRRSRRLDRPRGSDAM